MSEKPIEAAELLRHLMDSTADHIYFKDRESRFICINQAQTRWMKLASPDEAIGKTDFDFFADEHATDAFEDEQRIISTERPILGKEEKETWPDGSVTWVSTTKMPLLNDAGEIIGTFGISRDITHHRLVQEKAARYAWKLRNVNKQMRNELAMARELQDAMLPTRYPTFPPDIAPEESALRFAHHYHAAGQVGGDFFAVFPLSDHKCAMFICDVMGHGVQAALITAMVRTVVNEWCPIEEDPGALLAKINGLLLPFLRRDDILIFASAFYVTIDASTGTAHSASAGHPSPLWVRPRDDGARLFVESAADCGPALGLETQPHYETFEKKMVPGDKLLLFTDGLFEMEDADNHEYGLERLQLLVSQCAREPLDSIFDAVHEDTSRFRGGTAIVDDVCVFGMEFQHLIERTQPDEGDRAW